MNQKLTLSSTSCYNISEKCCLTETTPPVYFASDDKRTQQTTNNRRRREPYAFWRNLLNSAVLQKTANQEAFSTDINIPSAVQSLSSNRLNHCHYLFHHCWHQSVKQDKVAATKWSLSENSWNQKFSIRKQPAKVSETLRSKDPIWHQQDTRPVEIEDVLSSTTPHKHPLRFRFDCGHHLRQTDRRSQSRIQSRQKGKTFLSSVSLFRVLHKRFLARSFKTWGRLYCRRRSGIPEGMHSKDSAHYLPHQSTGRFRILRPQVYRTFRRKKNRLCDRGESDRRYQEKASWFTVSPVQERLVSCRVSVCANELEKSPSLYCDSQETSQQARGTANLVYTGTVFLPNIRYEPSFRSSQHLVFLQRPRFYRTSHQRAETRFLFDQDTHEQFFGKSSLFFFTSSGVQHHQLVQTALSAGTIEKFNTGYHSFGNFSVSGKTNKQTSSKYSKTSKGSISFKPVVELYHSENRKVKDPLIFADLLNFQKHVPSRHYKNQAFSRFF